MNGLTNAFALLDVDVEDDRVVVLGPNTPVKDLDAPAAAAATRAKGKQKSNKSPDVAVVKEDQQNQSITSEQYQKPLVWIDLEMTAKGKQKSNKSPDVAVVKEDQQNQSITSEQYQKPLVWIDLEMTGLDVKVDRILEIACIITDGNLTKSVEGPDIVINQSKECLDGMGEWCVSHHAASGLTERVLQSTISEREAEKRVLAFVKKYVEGTHAPLLAGNSVYVDFLFLKKYMPDLASIFSHVLVDVSSITALCIRWYPKEKRKAPSKENKHRAMDDIKESIKELKFYKENIFIKPRSRK